MKVAGVEVPPEVVTLVLEDKRVKAVKLAMQKISGLGRVGDAKVFVDRVKAVVNSIPTQFITIDKGAGALLDWMKFVEKRLMMLEHQKEQSETGE